jgi:hypothetical protein
MRHDKEGFAQEAIAMAGVGKQIGDYLRILLFSAYADALPPGADEIKNSIGPFTGCFVSQLPITVTLLRFALKAAILFNEGNHQEAMDFLRTGVLQLQEELSFTQGRPSALQQVYERERLGWQIFYKSLAAVEQGLRSNEDWALSVRKAAKRIVSQCILN